MAPGRSGTEISHLALLAALHEQAPAQQSSFSLLPRRQQKEAGLCDDEEAWSLISLFMTNNKILHDGGVFTLAYENQTKRRKLKHTRAVIIQVCYEVGRICEVNLFEIGECHQGHASCWYLYEMSGQKPIHVMSKSTI
jgi:hypothetical protein